MIKSHKPDSMRSLVIVLCEPSFCDGKKKKENKQNLPLSLSVMSLIITLGYHENIKHTQQIKGQNLA